MIAEIIAIAYRTSKTTFIHSLNRNNALVGIVCAAIGVVSPADTYLDAGGAADDSCVAFVVQVTDEIPAICVVDEVRHIPAAASSDNGIYLLHETFVAHFNASLSLAEMYQSSTNFFASDFS